jgi:hypothetical protein
MMPKKAADARASQKAALAGVLYDKARPRPLQCPVRRKRRASLGSAEQRRALR